MKPASDPALKSYLHFLRLEKNASPNTVESYRRDLERFLSYLADAGIGLNTVNPGPVNTGYMDPETTDRSLDGLQEYLASTPFGRVGTPQDPAELIGWLATSSGSWVVGQVLTSDGGFSL